MAAQRSVEMKSDEPRHKAPLGPPPPFFRFQQDLRKQLIRTHPEWNVEQIKEAIATAWNTVPEATKKQQRADFKLAQAQHALKMRAYNAQIASV
jgi:hypothetical protein